jgi:GNAT superfamily N-acetyltransferase
MGSIKPYLNSSIDGSHGNTLSDGTPIKIRVVRPTDDNAILELFHSLSPRSVYFRFMAPLKHLTERQLKDLMVHNPKKDIALVVTLYSGTKEIIVGWGGYYQLSEHCEVEVALMVADHWHGKGIGRLLLAHLTGLARQMEFSVMIAEVMPTNLAMLKTLAGCSCPVRRKWEDGIIQCEIALNSPSVSATSQKQPNL